MVRANHSLCWVRRDLRLADHTALSEAARQYKSVAVVFVFDTTLLNRLKDKDDKRVGFIHQSLVEMDQKLKARGSALLVLHGDPKTEIPKIAKNLKVKAVFANRDYDPAAKKRDSAVKRALQDFGIRFHTYKDQVIFEGLEIKTGQGEPYKVFTPYKNTWLSAITKDQFKECKVNQRRFTPKKILKTHLKNWSLERLGFSRSPIWLAPGEKAAHQRMRRFQAHLASYHKDRDFPFKENGTSGLSVHLRFGTISIRSLVRFAKNNSSSGSRAWLTELVWRDFYQMILDQFPHVVNGAFKKEYDNINWPGRNDHFEAWKDGRTGYPLVDAAMRHFNESGWMHNRLRMIVASFLTKDLLVDWRKGEAWFARKLLDFDLAANNGGWQWSASTGCDAQPYFRIFNPVTQSKRFDPNGEFIRAHVPDLRGFDKKNIHWPHSLETRAALPSYPAPLVDHSVQRLKVVNLFAPSRLSTRSL